MRLVIDVPPGARRPRCWALGRANAVEREDCGAHVLLDEIGVDGDGGGGSFAGGRDDLGAGIRDVACDPHTCDARRPRCRRQAICPRRAHTRARRAGRSSARIAAGRTAPRRRLSCPRRERRRRGGRPRPGSAARLPRRCGSLGPTAGDARQPPMSRLARYTRDRQTTGGRSGHTAPPRASRRARRAFGLASRSRGSRGNGARRAPTALEGPGCRGAHRANRSRREAGEPDRAAVAQDDAEAEAPSGTISLDATSDDLHAVALDLLASDGQQLGGGHAVARQEPLHVRGGSVARLTGIDHRDTASRPAEHESRAEPAAPPPITTTS